MLIVTRNPGSSIILGDNDIKITVLGCNGNQVRIGIVADESISIARDEIFEKYQHKHNKGHIGIISNNKKNKKLTLPFKQCPDCFNDKKIALHETKLPKENFLFYVKCDNCECQTTLFKTPDEAIQAWDYFDR